MHLRGSSKGRPKILGLFAFLGTDPLISLFSQLSFLAAMVAGRHPDTPPPVRVKVAAFSALGSTQRVRYPPLLGIVISRRKGI